MTTQVAPLGLRLFMEGVEVPVISAQVVVQPGQPSAAAIQIVPADSALMFLPRTLVHLFFLDSELSVVDQTLADRVLAEQALFPTTPRTKIDRFDVEDDRYRLLFSGEVIGYNYSKTPSSRCLVLQCLDLSSYWDTCYQWFADYSVTGDGLTDRTHNFVAAGEMLFNNIAAGTRWTIGDILQSAPASPRYKNTKGLLAGYIHLLESIGGLRPKANTYPGFRGVNDFFTLAELRYNLTGMIGAVGDDTTSSKMYAHKAFFNWLEQGMASAGSLVSFRDALKLVGQYIYHEVYPNPAAKFVKGGERVQQRLTNIYSESRVGRDIATKIQDAITSVTAVRSKLASLTGEDGAGELPNDDGLDSLRKAIQSLNVATELLSDSGSTDAAVVGQELASATVNLNRILSSIQSEGIASTETGVKLALGRASDFANELDTPLDTLDKIINTRVTRRVTETREVTTSDHLFNQLLLPETYFVVPPRCNVIFPDQITQFNFNRNYFREVSRLACGGGLSMLTGGGRSGAQIFANYYFAPNIKDVRGKIARKTIFASGSTIMPHEIHSGIIPKIEWVTDGQRWGIQAAKYKGVTTEEQRKIAYLQRLANFQFFLHRFNARQMSCVMRFNPYLVLGLPAVVIDRSTPSAAVIETLSDVLGTGRAVLPTAYIGKIMNLVHDINQAGGQTTVAFQYARTHRGIDDEFLGVLWRERRDIDNQVYTVVAANIVAAHGEQDQDDAVEQLLIKYLDKSLAVGSQFQDGKVISIEEGSETLIPLTFASLEPIGMDAEVFGEILQRQIELGLVTTDSDAEVASIFVPPVIKVTVRKKTGQGRFVSPDGALPPEVLLKPGWYSDVWDPDRITESVYLPLLGCTSITDDQQIGDADGFIGLVSSFFTESGMADTAVEAVTTEDGAKVVQVNGKSIAVFDLATGSLEQAIDGVTMLYGLLKMRGLDVQRFINDYTKRPIASLSQILGSSDLEFDADGNVVDTETMIEGFHSRAFGDYNTDVKHRLDTGEDSEEVEPVAGEKALFGLLPPASDTIAGPSKFNRSIVDRSRVLPDIPPYLDPRGRARQRVLAYSAELGISRGISAT
jgi:hypothetical protein